MNQEKLYTILKSIKVSEKSARLAEGSQYVFEVDVTATKPEIKEAVEALFNVKVVAVNVMNLAGKRKMFRGRQGRRNAVRKAIISLQAGQQLEYVSAE